MSNRTRTKGHSPDDATIGLLNIFVSLAHSLRQCDLSSPAVQKALDDLRANDDLVCLLGIDDEWPDERIIIRDPDGS